MRTLNILSLLASTIIVLLVVSACKKNDPETEVEDGFHSPVWFQEIYVSTNGIAAEEMDLDASGNLFLLAQNDQATITIGDDLVSARGNHDGALLKFNQDGKLQFGKSVPSSYQIETVNDIDVSSAGNVIIGGMFRGQTEVDGTSYTGTSEVSAFVLKLNNDGSKEWFQIFEGTSSGTYVINSVSSDFSGSVIIAGYATDTMMIGANQLWLEPHFSFIASLNSSGEVSWAKAVPANYISKIDVDASGNIYAVGAYNGSFELDGKSYFSTNHAAFLARFNQSGQLEWLQNEADNNVYLENVMCSENHVYATGRIEGSSTFGGGRYIVDQTTGIIAQYTHIGNLNWMYHGIELESWATGYSEFEPMMFDCTTDNEGNVYVVGTNIHIWQEFDGSEVSGGSVTKLSNEGKELWHEFYGSKAISVSWSSPNKLYVYGEFEGEPRFGDTNFVSFNSESLFILETWSD